MSVPPTRLGTAEQAIAFVLSGYDPDMGLQEREFLQAWRDGDTEEWPLYEEWLETREGKMAQ